MIGQTFRKPTVFGMAVATAQQWVYDAGYTHYRLLIVDTPGPFGDPNDIYPPSTYLMVEPASGRRAWFPVSRDADVISEDYIAEKTGATGADAHALTTLIAEALGRTPKYLDDTVEPIEEKT